jgi:uncharacterized protein YaaR (DUF327 family)
MKIGEAHNSPDLPGPGKKVKGKDAGPAKGLLSGLQAPEEAAFGKALMDASRQQSVRALEQILGELDASGERLAAAQNFDELDKYKALVKEFMLKVTQGVGKLHFSEGGGKSGKIHVILQTVDKELEALAKEVVSRQTPQLRILERLDQIRGLLLDLYK